jgi:hypothetical protein
MKAQQRNRVRQVGPGEQPGPRSKAGALIVTSSHLVAASASALTFDNTFATMGLRTCYDENLGRYGASRTISNSTRPIQLRATESTNNPTHSKRAAWQIDAPTVVHHSRCSTSGPARRRSGQAKSLARLCPATPGPRKPEKARAGSALLEHAWVIVLAAVLLHAHSCIARKARVARGVWKPSRQERDQSAEINLKYYLTNESKS